jgi:tetratricopeptide (TPR) repeat protein
MEQHQFESHYNNLGDKCRAVLREKLKGKTNQEIAKCLGIRSEATVRQHLRAAYKEFELSDEDRRGSWSDLQALFFQFKRELILSSAPKAESSWVGRSSDIEKLHQWVGSNHKILLIVGEGGIGKTSLANKFLASYDWEKPPLTIKIALESKYIQTAEVEVQRWLQQEFNENVPRNFIQSLSLLEKKLRLFKVPIFIDNLETVLTNGEFLPEYRDYVELLRVLNEPSIKGFTLITSREKLKEPKLAGIKNYALSGLTVLDWQQFFNNPQDSKALQALQAIHNACNGNAKAMELLHSIIEDSYDGDINDFYKFWLHNYQATQQQETLLFLISDQLKFLVDYQLDRLNTHSSVAYHLLCRLAACRYQVIEWLPDDCVRSLLWDVPAAEQLGVTHRLCDCSLVQFHRGKYHMHPGVRSAGLSQLKASPEWEQTNRAIAQYWFSSVENVQSSQQGLQVLEAYYHFLEIADYDAAWSVLRRPATSILPEELFLYFLSWGFIREVLELAQALEGRVSPSQEPSLYRCLGDCHIYLLEDGVETAISWHRRAQAAAQREGDTWTQFNSYSDLGLCYIVAGEYELGLETYQAKLNLALSQISLNIQARRNSCYCELALLHSCLGQVSATENALKVAEGHLQEPLKCVPPWQACWDLNMAGLAQKNIGQYAQAFQTLEQAIVLATTFNFIPDRTRSWYILGDVYRETGNFETSIHYQQLAIEFFTKVGAKYELAESHYYLGLTYRDLGQLKTAESHWQQAIKLFHQIQTPKQENKVLACFN